MNKNNVFLSLSGELSLYVGPGDLYIDIDHFFELSKEGMSKEMAAKYAEKFAKFTDELMEYAKSND